MQAVNESLGNSNMDTNSDLFETCLKGSALITSIRFQCRLQPSSSFQILVTTLVVTHSAGPAPHCSPMLRPHQLIRVDSATGSNDTTANQCIDKSLVLGKKMMGELMTGSNELHGVGQCDNLCLHLIRHKDFLCNCPRLVVI